jgi:hypothetical protein
MASRFDRRSEKLRITVELDPLFGGKSFRLLSPVLGSNDPNCYFYFSMFSILRTNWINPRLE